MRISFLGLRSIGEGSGGVERHVHELATRMARQGHQVNVFCRGRYQTETVHCPGLRVIPKPTLYTKHLEAISHTGAALPEAIRRADVVHFQALGPSLLSWVPRLARTRSVVTIHGLDYQRAKWNALARNVLRMGAWTALHCPHATIAVSRPLCHTFEEMFGKAPTYIPNGISRPELRPLERLRRFGLEDSGYLLFLGRLVPEKGCHLLIQAFRDLDTDRKLLICGDASHTGEYVARLRELARDDPRIVFTGPVYGAEKDEAFSNAGLFVLPSDLEGMPIVLLEAMSYGCPVLASDIDAVLDTFDPDPHQAREQLRGHFGFHFRAGQVQDLRTRLEAALGHPDLRNMGRRARDMALQAYDWDAITAQTLAVYRSVLK
jgi:glycosyltransferase involved in cell wall biosynthesis